MRLGRSIAKRFSNASVCSVEEANFENCSGTSECLRCEQERKKATADSGVMYRTGRIQTRTSESRCFGKVVFLNITTLDHQWLSEFLTQY